MKRLTLNRPCKDCGKVEPEVSFYYYPEGSKGAYKSGRKAFAYCTDCWPKRKKLYDYKRRYGITPDEFDFMYVEQSGQCKICQRSILHPRDITSNKQTNIDHDHVSNKVRGLLCYLCNQGLGSFRDDPEVLYRAIAYIQGSLS